MKTRHVVGAFAAAVVAAVVGWERFLDSELEDYLKQGFSDSVSFGSWDEFTPPQTKQAIPRRHSVNLPRDLSPFATITNNPLNLSAIPKAPSTVVHEDRKRVTLDKPAYYAVGRLVQLYNPSGPVTAENTASWCTATITEIDGYRTSTDITLSSSHCFEEGIPLDHYRFVSHYVSRYSGESLFISGLNDVYKTSPTDENIPLSNIRDIAVISLKKRVPDEIMPARAIPDYEYTQDQPLEIMGFSWDKSGLYTHRGAKANAKIGLYALRTNGDMAPGASGAGVGLENDGKRLKITAINMQYIKKSWAFHYTISSHDLVQAARNSSFIWKEDVPDAANQRATQAQAPSTTGICVEVTASKLNIRAGAGTNYPAIGHANHGDTTIELGRINGWSIVELEGGGEGYMYEGQKRQYLRRFPCIP